MNDLNSPIIILSSARSGSKLLREILTSSNELVCYPYDVNYIWKYNNFKKKHDELSKKDLNANAKSHIRKYFYRLRNKNPNKRILEKTVSNSLRPEFVKAVFPEAKIIHLYRDGREVTASLKSCWKAPAYSKKNQPLNLMLKKALSFPVYNSMPYLAEYIKNSISVFNHKKTLKSWGPRFDGIDEEYLRRELIEICAMQWNKSVEKTVTFLKKEKVNNDYINIKYEELVASPRKILTQLGEFIGLSYIDEVVEHASSTVFLREYSSWNTLLSEEERDLAFPIIKSNLKMLGYLSEN